MSQFELIIFDCDGVLVDSETISNKVFTRVLNEEFGFSLTTEEVFQKFVGHSPETTIATVKEMLGKEPPANFARYYRDETNKALAKDIEAVKGIEKAISEIALPMCVASNGPHEKMHITLGKTQLIRHFEGKLHSSDDVAQGKPFPDVYLYAASQMGDVDPAKCLVIEDSPIGVKAGLAAGMTVFGFAEHMDEHKLKQAGAHHTFKHMGDLKVEIEQFEQKTI